MQPDLESSLVVVGGHAGVSMPAHVHGGVGPVLDGLLRHSLVLAGAGALNVLRRTCRHKRLTSRPQRENWFLTPSQPRKSYQGDHHDQRRQPHHSISLQIKCFTSSAQT